ncbi:rhodanese-like domain-containing protein [Flavobacterium beibuense]|uniref:Rhodanese-like protein n=1 Tax=Flavobacterium beibuense TaxID=657326 RepID=A0A444WIW5_9FLAO|nr:rhodanese-like domain-containing protein [Flavobacterium beibuense]RYJ45813.1 Rhodanese-like protein [Flavobacterium beibuense]
MKKALYLAVLFISLISCQAQQKEGTELVNPTEFAQKIESEKGQLIDVRTPKEYQSGYIDGAVNIHLYDKDFEERIDKLDKNETVYVYCKAGGRSAEAVEIMQEKGFKHIVELDGGIDAWNEAAKPVKK